MSGPAQESKASSRRRSRKPRRSGGNARLVPLYKRSSSHFSPEDRQRGTDYFREDRVRLEIDGKRATAKVEGNDQPLYRVGIDWTRVSDRRVHIFCECPAFANGRSCKHLWAALLALGEAGAEHQPPGKDRLGLRKDRAARWPELGVSQGESETPPAGRSRRRRSNRDRSSHGTSWRSQLDAVRDDHDRVREAIVPVAATNARPTPVSTGIRFLINLVASTESEGLVLDLFEKRPANGPRRKTEKLKRASLSGGELERLLRASDDHSTSSLPVITALPISTTPSQGRGRKKKAKKSGIQRFRLPPALFDPLLPQLAAQGDLGWWDGRAFRTVHDLKWDHGTPWELVLKMEPSDDESVRLRAYLERNGDSVTLARPKLIVMTDDAQMALAVFPETVALLAAQRERDLPWIRLLRKTPEMLIPNGHLEEAFSELLELPTLPRLEAPEHLQLEVETSEPRPKLVLEHQTDLQFGEPKLEAELSFDYGELSVRAGDLSAAVVDWDERVFVRRDLEAEQKAVFRLLDLGVRTIPTKNGTELELDPMQVPAVTEPLLREGWSVEITGASLRPPSPPALKVESGIDWFEVSGDIDFGGKRLGLRKVLEAIHRGERYVELDDGSQGLLPEDWMETYDSLAKLAHDTSEDGLRFLPSQALLVDALLASMPPANVDRAFADLRDNLQSFDRIKPRKELPSFEGELRKYQRLGLGWLCFLREFGLGGVLADDMGLGKTVQVLAMLQMHRTPSKSSKLPSLVVAPRSLVYNWIEEASRFTPKLKVVEYLGTSREALKEKLGKYDIVVTTYGTLRLDIAFLATVEFDTVVLDEAQAIKNPSSQTAKASRLLNGRHRLALTGTPIENHLGELGSIFEFLNPGLLGRLPVLEVLAGGRTPSEKELALVAEGIRPFILRRTKAEVLPDLPPKTEQVLQCTLMPRQRELYDELKTQYQQSLLEQVEQQGVGGSAIQVLQALLRLRQVACHPGLVDEEWDDAGSAKLETLFEQVREVLDEGHKVLVFSQFTKLLAYVRRQLDEEGVQYAYLDGKTRDRAGAVERFQNDPECNLFLISLKAGGTGLNLTAADYVFLLDPWWNPAVEAQAIDRAHRIGQEQPVFAYRLIARDTVEEKILELQKSKRQIADAILEGEGEGGSVKDLTAEDLKVLLS